MMRGRIELNRDRAVVGRLARERPGSHAGEATHQAPVYPQRHHVAGDVRGLTRADVAEAGQQGRADQVVVAQHGGAERENLGDAPELAAIQHLAVREVDVGNRELAEVEDLADAVEHRPGRQRQYDRGAAGQRQRAPRCEAVDAARLRRVRSDSP
jgi:hypothetical protein